METYYQVVAMGRQTVRSYHVLDMDDAKRIAQRVSRRGKVAMILYQCANNGHWYPASLYYRDGKQYSYRGA